MSEVWYLFNLHKKIQIMSLTNAVIFRKQAVCKNNTHNRGALL